MGGGNTDNKFSEGINTPNSRGETTEQTIAYAKSLIGDIERGGNRELASRLQHACEKERIDTIQACLKGQKETKESLINMRAVLEKEESFSGFEKKMNLPDTNFSSLTSDEKRFFFQNFSEKIGGNITNSVLIKEALNYGGEEKSGTFNYSMYKVLSPQLKGDFSIIEACLDDKNFKGYISNNDEDITNLIPKSFFQNPQNTTNFLNKIVGMSGYKVADIIPRVIAISTDDIDTRNGIYKNIIPKLNPEGITQVLHDMSDEVFKKYVETERNFLEGQIGKEGLDSIIANREINTERFARIVDRITDDGTLSSQDLKFLDTQMIKAGGIGKHEDTLKRLLQKNPAHFVDVKSIHGNQELALIAATSLKVGIYPYLSSDLKQDINLLKTIFQTQEDFDRGLALGIMGEIGDKNTKKDFLIFLKQQGIEIGTLDTYSLRSAEAGFEERLKAEISLTDQAIASIENIETGTTESSVLYSKNGDGTYNVTIQGQTIPGLTEEEYRGLGSKEAKENLLHFYTVLKDCGLEQIWGQRKSIFTAISNKKGIAFDTKDGDYIKKNEVRIFLQSIIKSIAPQFKEQSELTQALNTENEQEIISFIKNYNGENNLTESAKDKFGRTKIVEIFFDTYFPQNDDRKFQQSSFEKTLQSK